MPILKLETSDGKFTYDMARREHFIIDCACNGKDGRYSGSHYKNGDENLEGMTERYEPLDGSKFEHTFYISDAVFLPKLVRDCKESKGQKPLIIICNDCRREFPFTWESYLELQNKMMEEYNKRLSEIQKASENRSS